MSVEEGKLDRQLTWGSLHSVCLLIPINFQIILGQAVSLTGLQCPLHTGCQSEVIQLDGNPPAGTLCLFHGCVTSTLQMAVVNKYLMNCLIIQA